VRRSLAPVPRWLVSTAILFGGLFAIAYVGPTLTRRGLPGGLFAAGIVAVLMALALRVVLRDLPPRGRRRDRSRIARELGVRMRIRPRLPRSMGRLPSLSDPRAAGRDGWHLIVVGGDPPILTFDRRLTVDDVYAAPVWFTSAACRIELDAPALIVEPRPMIAADPLGPLLVWSSESGGFGRRSRIRTGDRLFATTFLDQRMLAWMLEQDPRWIFEVGGGWAMVSHRGVQVEGGFEAPIAILRDFISRIPRAASSSYAAAR
jgi:hypothetical protein